MKYAMILKELTWNRSTF